ncbi:MAG: O-sialoglycoprotein endopeptidase [Anaerovoracaceae bacterium]|jgi:N6-L-threonylcarbamoyladenine synthase
MSAKNYILGIDTSNYTTSVAITNKDGMVVADVRKPLKVKQGERGLRQSYALFQHFENFPQMISQLFQQIEKEQIGVIAVSSRPRPVEGSYMPVFKAGVNYGKVLAASLEVPLLEFSHQEGHIEAIKHRGALHNESHFLAFHLSGGTTELLYIKNNEYELIGGSKDISFGQVLDRVGVAMNLKFPAGKEMDLIAQEEKNKHSIIEVEKLKKIPRDGLFINLSGIETQCQRRLAENENNQLLVMELFDKISLCLCQLTEEAVKETGCTFVLFTGGVAASSYIRKHITDYFQGKDLLIQFGDPLLSSDNAVGISMLGGNKLWP